MCQVLGLVRKKCPGLCLGLWGDGSLVDGEQQESAGVDLGTRGHGSTGLWLGGYETSCSGDLELGLGVNIGWTVQSWKDYEAKGVAARGPEVGWEAKPVQCEEGLILSVTGR